MPVAKLPAQRRTTMLTADILRNNLYADAIDADLPSASRSSAAALEYADLPNCTIADAAGLLPDWSPCRGRYSGSSVEQFCKCVSCRRRTNTAFDLDDVNIHIPNFPAFAIGPVPWPQGQLSTSWSAYAMQAWPCMAEPLQGHAADRRWWVG